MFILQPFKNYSLISPHQMAGSVAQIEVLMLSYCKKKAERANRNNNNKTSH